MIYEENVLRGRKKKSERQRKDLSKYPSHGIVTSQTCRDSLAQSSQMHRVDTGARGIPSHTAVSHWLSDQVLGPSSTLVVGRKISEEG